MHNHYSDIYDLAAVDGETPMWWDENGVPRFAPFDRHLCPNIYADWIALLRIRCEVCGQQFLAEVSWDSTFAPPPDAQTFHYGDPPWHYDRSGHACAGNTMSSDTLEVVRVWTRAEVEDQDADQPERQG